MAGPVAGFVQVAFFAGHDLFDQVKVSALPAGTQGVAVQVGRCCKDMQMRYKG